MTRSGVPPRTVVEQGGSHRSPSAVTDGSTSRLSTVLPEARRTHDLVDRSGFPRHGALLLQDPAAGILTTSKRRRTTLP